MDDTLKTVATAAAPAAPAKGIQVTENALEKIRSAMVKENVSPEQGGLASWACRAADARD